MSRFEDYFQCLNDPPTFENGWRREQSLMSKPESLGKVLTTNDIDFKRKMPDTPVEYLQAKHSMKQNQQYPNLGRQNSVLASLLTQTSVTSTSVPRNRANDIFLQSSQESFLKNRKVTLVHTPPSGRLSSNEFIDTNSDFNSGSALSDSELSLILDNVISLEEEFKISRQREDLLSCAQEAISRIKGELKSCEASTRSESPLAKLYRELFSPAETQKVVDAYSPDNWFSAIQPPPNSVPNSSTVKTQAPRLNNLPNNLNMANPQRRDLHGLPQSMKASEPFQKMKNITKQQQTYNERKLAFFQPIQKRLNTRQIISHNIQPKLRQVNPTLAPLPEGLSHCSKNAVVPNAKHQHCARISKPQISPRYNVQQTMNTTVPPSNSQQLSLRQCQQQSFYPILHQYHGNQHHPIVLITQVDNDQTCMQQAYQSSPLSLNAQQDPYAGQQSLSTNQQQQAHIVSVRPMLESQNSANSFFQQTSLGPAFQQQQNPTMLHESPQQNMQMMPSVSSQGDSPQSSPSDFTENSPMFSPQSSPCYYNSPSSTNEAPVSTSPDFSTDLPASTYNEQQYSASRNHSNGGYYMTSKPLQELNSMDRPRAQKRQFKAT